MNQSLQKAPRQLSETEIKLGEMAAHVVAEAGGAVTFDQYDRLMIAVHYIPPFNWLAGWGLGARDKKANDDKLCAFAAVRLGLLEQTDRGYRTVAA